MPAFRSMTARMDRSVALGGTGVGTTALDARRSMAALLASAGGIAARPGVFAGAPAILVTGTAGWNYSVPAAHFAVSRGASDGVHIFGNDGATSIATGAAPGAGTSRIDIVWVRHPSNTENGDTSSVPVFGCAQSLASATPLAPSIPAGALELARNTVLSTATTTASAGNAITQTFPWTALRGAPIPVRNEAERTALGAVAEGSSIYRIDARTTEVWNGSTWASPAGFYYGEYDPGAAVTNAIGPSDTLIGTGVTFTITQQRRVRIVTRARFFASVAGQIVYVRSHIIAGATAVVAGSTPLGPESQGLTPGSATGYSTGVTQTHERSVALVAGTYTAFPVGGSTTGSASSFASPYTAVYDVGPV